MFELSALVVPIISIVVSIATFIYARFVKKDAIDRTKAIKEERCAIDNGMYLTMSDNDWWSETGIVAGLHQMNHVRVDYIKSVIDSTFVDQSKSPSTKKHTLQHRKPKKSLKIIEVGCGGGILCEGIARAGLAITGVDVSEQALRVARMHAEQLSAELQKNLNYTTGSVYTLPFEDNSVDVIVISDVIEHLFDLPAAIKEMNRVLNREHGVLVFDTFNRTILSFIFGIIVVQEVFRFVPPKTHDWQLFVKPEELATLFEQNELTLRDVQGITPAFGRSIYNTIVTSCARALNASFYLSSNTQISYIGFASRHTAGENNNNNDSALAAAASSSSSVAAST